jgi:hypothetical protein
VHYEFSFVAHSTLHAVEVVAGCLMKRMFASKAVAHRRVLHNTMMDSKAIAGGTVTVYFLLVLLLLQSWLNFDAHTGTHIDAPAHFLKGGSTIEDLDLDTLVGKPILKNIIIMNRDSKCIGSHSEGGSTIEYPDLDTLKGKISQDERDSRSNGHFLKEGNMIEVLDLDALIGRTGIQIPTNRRYIASGIQPWQVYVCLSVIMLLKCLY